MGVLEGMGAAMEARTEIEEIVGFRRDDDLLGHYVRELHKYMTADDVRDAIKRAKLIGNKTSDKLWAANKACDGVAGLMDSSHGSLAHWAALGVESLTGCLLSVAEFKTPRPFQKSDAPYETIEDLHMVVEEGILDAADDGAPWSDEDKAKVRAWLSQTPYQIWLLVNELEEWGQDALRESMFDLARDADDGASLARNMRDRWERVLIDKWERNWKSRWDGSVPAPLA
jgi:hypothetical protein